MSIFPFTCYNCDKECTENEPGILWQVTLRDVFYCGACSQLISEWLEEDTSEATIH